jgi:cbb3-type cytochrome oxidase subunit 3
MMDIILEHAPTIALLGFFIGFIGISCWAYAPKNKQKLEQNAQIPFKE